MVRIQHRYTREEILSNPKTYYIFGDNLTQTGLGGQAGAARGCRNTIGLPTLVSPSEPASPESYWKLKWTCFFRFLEIEMHLKLGRTVVWPQDGVGTGIANLKQNCPELLYYINTKISNLMLKYGVEDES